MYNNVLLPVDLNEESSWTTALPRAVDCCRAFKATLHLMTVLPDLGMPIVAQYFPEDYLDRAVADATAKLEELSAKHVPAGIAVDHRVAHGTIYKEILSAATDLGCDLIVMAAHRPELEDYLIGPNAARVVRHGKCSVLVVRR